MNCMEIRERMPDVAAGLRQPTTDEGQHLASCAACAEQLKAMGRGLTRLHAKKEACDI